jgi:hypothetical protein
MLRVLSRLGSRRVVRYAFARCSTFLARHDGIVQGRQSRRHARCEELFCCFDVEELDSVSLGLHRNYYHTFVRIAPEAS